MQQLLLGDHVRMHVRGGLGEGSPWSFALKSQPLLPSCWVSAAAGVRQERAEGPSGGENGVTSARRGLSLQR